MARLWEIRESYGERGRGRYGNRSNDYHDYSDEEQEAYECGYADAMKKVYGERDPYMGERMPYISYRDDDDMYMGERRRRDSMGRYR